MVNAYTPLGSLGMNDFILVEASLRLLWVVASWMEKDKQCDQSQYTVYIDIIAIHVAFDLVWKLVENCGVQTAVKRAQ